MPTSPTIALVGNPNTGKTTLFNALSGLNQRVGNYPGVTVETKKGRWRYQGQTYELIDLPGTYSLAPRSPDEMVAVELLLGQKAGEPSPSAVVIIVDASNLERNLYLMTQVRELGVPVIVALNMMDVARNQGLEIDTAALSRRLGVPVVPLQANKLKGIEELKAAIAQLLDRGPDFRPERSSDRQLEPGAASGRLEACPTVDGVRFPDAFESEVAGLRNRLGPDVSPFLVRRLLLDVGGYAEQVAVERGGPHFLDEVRAVRRRLVDAGCPIPGVEARARYGWIRSATAECVRRPAQRPVTWTDQLDRILTHWLWGSLAFLALMFVVFQSIYAWAAPLMDWIGAGQETLAAWVGAALTPGPLRSLLVDGVIGGVGSVLVFIPQIFILFAFIAILEDCGYMARAAFLMDRIMARAGLNGKSFIPLLSSVACAVPGIMAARVIENRRDRLATILVAPLMSCSARLPVYMLLIAAFLSSEAYPFWVPGLTLFAMYAIGLVVAPLVAFALKRTLLRGATPVFVMEMPLYKVPSLRLILRRSVEASWMFVRRAGTLILASMIVVWALLYFPVTRFDGENYDVMLANLEAGSEPLREEIDQLKEQLPDRPELAARIAALEETSAAMEETSRALEAEWKGQSWLGRAGKWLEPLVRPLGWDWRIGMAALASFPAREVMVGTLGLIFSEGQGEADDDEYQAALGDRLRAATWDDDPARPLFSVPVALSIMVFFALCCQCVSTLAIIKRETNSWRWPIFTFVYMTLLAYLGALTVYQVGVLFT
jgi:ferrous iron transport protein B